MGRSSASWLKIIACGSDSSADKDPEMKGDKRGWSFRKKSARHRVLSNTVIAEIPSPPPLAVKKEAPESAADVKLEPPTDIEVPEKVPIQQCVDEKPQLPVSVYLKQSDPDPVVDTKTETTADFQKEESAVLLIQSAVRVFLAQRELLKVKNVIKLQAAVRGHLVRSHAVGTLRCVQAIVKMQALVRARRARASEDEKPIEDAPKSKASDKENLKSKPSVSYISIEKLLSNRFARQLLESTPREKPINIKCDMSKSNSAWKWLERWMSVSSAEPSPNTDLTAELPKSEIEDSPVSQEETKNPPEVYVEPADSSCSKNEMTTISESDDNVITYEDDKIKFEECHSELPVVQEITVSPVLPEIIEAEHPQSMEVEAFHDSPSTEPSGAERSAPDAQPEAESEQLKRSMKRSASEELETEGKKSASGSRNATNPAFIAAQSKFEELTSAVNSGGSINSSDESKLEIAISQEESMTETKELSLAENSANDQARLQVGWSECETELSISSTLDSPDRYDAGRTAEFEDESKVPKEGSCSSPDLTVIPDSTLSNSPSEYPEKESDYVASGPTDSIVPTEAVEDENLASPNLQRDGNSEAVEQAHNGSPEASPRSHITVPESHGTPASQVSVNTKGSKIDKTGSNSINKRKSLSKKLPSSPYNDSGAGSTNTQSGKDQKSSKRRNSFGSARTENPEQEPRESSSSNSLPRFMQVTESAKAKLNASSSPRSSPDVSDRESFVKKRHSLPGANGRQGSPRIQRSTSQAHQGGKANGNGGASQERKWLR